MHRLILVLHQSYSIFLFWSFSTDRFFSMFKSFIFSRCKERQIPGYKGYVPMEPVECTFDPYLADLYQSNA